MENIENSEHEWFLERIGAAIAGGLGSDRGRFEDHAAACAQVGRDGVGEAKFVFHGEFFGSANSADQASRLTGLNGTGQPIGSVRRRIDRLLVVSRVVDADRRGCDAAHVRGSIAQCSAPLLPAPSSEFLQVGRRDLQATFSFGFVPWAPCSFLVSRHRPAGGLSDVRRWCFGRHRGRVRMPLRPCMGTGASLMSPADIFGLVVSLAVLVYLVYALFRGERF